MIQRIQTVYLLSAGLLLAAFLGVVSQAPPLIEGPLAAVSVALLVVTALAAVLAFGAIALFKNRSLQRRVITWALWLDLLVIAGTLVALYVRMQDGVPVAAGTLLVSVAPIVAYLLLRLGRAGVDRDIATVRSMDRIR